MLWSLLKIVIFLAIAAALAYGASALLETPGEVLIAFGGREFALTPIGFVLGLIVAGRRRADPAARSSASSSRCVRFLLGDETAITRYLRAATASGAGSTRCRAACWRSPPARRTLADAQGREGRQAAAAGPRSPASSAPRPPS